jgi:H+/gluconate symporter-like permease
MDISTSVALSAIVLVAAVAIYVILTVKGTSPIVSALAAVALLSIFAIGGFGENFFTTFTSGMANMVGGFFLIFTFGVMFGKTMEITGASEQMGRTLFRVMGEKNMIYALMIVTVLIAMTGAPHLGLMPPLTFALLRHSNLPRYIGLVAVAGAGTAATVLPGCLTTANVLPTEFLGTDVYAGPQIGIVAFVIQIVLVVIYVNYLMKKVRKDNIGYDPRENEPEMRADNDMPSFFWSIGPVFAVLILCAIFVLGFGLPSMWAMVFSTTLGMVILFLANHKYLHGSGLVGLKQAAEGVQPIIVCVLAVCGFANVVSNTAIYQKVVPVILDWNVHPAVIVVIGEMILVLLCADPISGVVAFNSTIGTTLVEKGVNASMIHRLSVNTCFSFDTVPHGGAVTMAMRMFGYDVKEGYKYMVVVNLIFPIVFSFVGMFMAMGMY